MLVELPSGQTVWHIGDPHLGRRFETGVPLDRRGEREARQMAKFKAELAAVCETNIMVGDLFDHPQVGLNVVLDTVDAYLEATDAQPDVQFFAMAGNHDRSRNLSAIGAWEIFKRLVEGRRKNLFVVDYAGQVENIAFFPWQWDCPANQQIADFAGYDEQHVELVVGHWDLQSFGGDDSHICPTKAILERFPKAKIVSGHYHLEGDYEVDGVTVSCTGSLEPYTHAEDPSGELYVTLTLDEVHLRDDLKDRCVRVLLKEGEELPVGLDCLALTGKRVTEEKVEVDRPDTFDWSAILDECLADVPDYVREFIDERLQVSG